MSGWYPPITSGRFGLHDLPDSAFRELAGPIEIRLPSNKHSIWHPSAAMRMIGKTTTIEVDGVRRLARIEHAECDDDPHYLLIRLVAID